MTTIQDRIIKDFWIFWGIGPFGSLKYKKGKELEQFLIKSIKEVEEETRKKILEQVKDCFIESQFRTVVDKTKFNNLSITNKEKQNDY